MSALIDRPGARGITLSSNSIAVLFPTCRKCLASGVTRSGKIG